MAPGGPPAAADTSDAAARALPVPNARRIVSELKTPDIELDDEGQVVGVKTLDTVTGEAGYLDTDGSPTKTLLLELDRTMAREPVLPQHARLLAAAAGEGKPD